MHNMTNQQNIDILLALSPYKSGVDTVMSAARDLLLNCLQMESHVHDIFFPEVIEHPLLRKFKHGTFPMRELSTAFVALAISKQKDDHKFHAMVSRSAVEETLRDIYDSVQWKKIGFLLYTLVYPDVVQDAKTGITLKDYMDRGGHVWAEKMVSEIMNPNWTMRYVQRIVRGQCSDEAYNRDMNALFVKLHLLDPQSVIPAYQFLLNQKALPAVNLELATHNYLGGPLDVSKIADQVATAIKKPQIPLNVSRLSLDAIEVLNGVEVDEFLVTEGRNLGLWTGKRPENQRTSKFSDRCNMM